MKERLRRNKALWPAVLLVVLLLLAVVPLLLHPDAFVVGSDDRAERLITTMQVGLRPWFRPLWEPGSARLENLLFALQAVAGLSAIAAFFIVKRRQRRQ